MFRNTLRTLRKEIGLTQKKLAKLLHVSETGYASWEQGKSQPDLDMLWKIADFFDVTADYLISPDEKASAGHADYSVKFAARSKGNGKPMGTVEISEAEYNEFQRWLETNRRKP